MTVTTSYPGVYIEEDSSPALSASHLSTVVPVFAVSDKFLVITKVNSWLDYLRNKGDGFDDGSVADISIRTYFENGGGPCYVVNKSGLTLQVPLHPDITLLVTAGQQISADTINSLCNEDHGVFALLDYMDGEITVNTDISATFSENSHAAVYYPNLITSWAAIPVPASALMAAFYYQNDRTRGVWKAPANMAIPAGYQPQYKVTSTLQGKFNSGLAINMLRQVDYRGPVVWGARTLEDSDNWRYVPVRRLFDSAERDIKTAMQSMVFETNNPPTWEKVRTAITNYLHSLWQQGALVGATEKEAYFVQIGKGLTMTDDDISQGKMIIKVGMAAVRPAEFIILQFSQNVEQQ
ncbi:phage tail protein [Citrobacter sp. NCU1]|uniref:phage tail sheath family protein n=1 Tax=Citrobacter sp. NCU1 TaxID=2026683 RepID=UPI0013912B38|nr:phage tail sheath family protein [Citrobacter sp. NCU1]NDO82789.1 phage tail protein [Citrobacter sp. NCU1]